MIQSNTEVYTFQDAVEAVLMSHDIGRDGINEARARQAVREAYRDIPSRHSWSYFNRQRLLQTVASYSTGTVVYDHTGGANERMLTLTSGTWPTWAAYGRVIISGVHYDVATRESSSIITLTDTSNPGDDVSSTTYTIYRNSYPLPANFSRLIAIWETSEVYPITMVDPASHHTGLQHFYSTPGVPRHATIRGSGKYLSGYEIMFGPPPSSALTYDLLFVAKPRALSIDTHSAGVVSITGTTAVTGTSSAFPANCVGAVIRLSDGPIKPSGMNGSLDGSDNPFVEQGIIKTRTSATALVLEEATSQTLSSVGYTISDPIDIEVGAMYTAFLRKAEAEFSRLAGRQESLVRVARAREALLEAMEADSRVENQAGRFVYNPYVRTTVNSE